MIKKTKIIESKTIKVDVNFGVTLKTLRKQNNKTQKEVAKFLNISTTSYSRYEQDLREPDFKTLAMLSALFDVSIGDFFLDAIIYKEQYEEKYETRINEKYIDNYSFVEHVEGKYYAKYKIEKRILKLIARVNTILHGENTIDGELEYLENQLKMSFKNYQMVEEEISEITDLLKIDDEIVKTLNRIQEYKEK